MENRISALLEVLFVLVVLLVPAGRAQAQQNVYCVTHKVVAGESLTVIAEKYGVYVDDIAFQNGIPNPNQIRVGASLTICLVGSPEVIDSVSPVLAATKPLTAITPELKGNPLAVGVITDNRIQAKCISIPLDGAFIVPITAVGCQLYMFVAACGISDDVPNMPVFPGSTIQCSNLFPRANQLPKEFQRREAISK